MTIRPLLAGKVLAEEARRKDEQEARGRDEVVIADDLLPGVGAASVSFWHVLRASGISLVGVLATLVLLDSMDTSAFQVLGPDIQRFLHLSDLQLGVTGALAGLTVFVAAVPLGYLGDRVRRTAIVGVCSLIWATCAVLTATFQAIWRLAIVRTVTGVGKANEQPVHSSLLPDQYPIESRNRVYALHRSAQPFGFVVGPALAGGIAAPAGGHPGWRWAFIILSLPAALLALIAFGLREPKREVISPKGLAFRKKVSRQIGG